jgi:DNA polymerase elongation subunit (family B)
VPKSLHFNQLDDRYERVAVLDIETGGYDGGTDPLIAIGVGRYDQSDGTAESKTFVLNTDVDQIALIRRAYDWIDEFAPDALVTFNGEHFDLPFLGNTIEAASVDGDRPALPSITTSIWPALGTTTPTGLVRSTRRLRSVLTRTTSPSTRPSGTEHR